MRKRTLLLPLIAALYLTGCSHGSENGITLSIMGKQSDLNKSYMTSIFQQYEKETGNKLQIIAYEDREYESIASEKFEAGDVPMCSCISTMPTCIGLMWMPISAISTIRAG